MEKSITLNKAAVFAKKAKEISRSIYQTKIMAYPVDAISAKNTEGVAKNLNEAVSNVSKDIRKIIAAMELYKQIKQETIKANVESGLHEVLCEIDMLKNKKQYMQTLIEATTNRQLKGGNRISSMGAAVIREQDIADGELVDYLSKICDNIVGEITRPDSKVSSIMLYVEAPGFTEEAYQEEIKKITKRISELEDSKYLINNNQKIVIDIPEILFDDLGI